MNYISTRNSSVQVSFKDAVMSGLAADGGLYMPEFIPVLPENFRKNWEKLSFQEICFRILTPFAGGEIPTGKFEEIVKTAFNFKAELIRLSDDLSVLELFHGPTLAFKDFGARFMAQTMNYFNSFENTDLNIFVATSGDTGSAIANAFHNLDGIRVFVLYPSGQVSELQEKQFTTLGGNITALEVEGTFDDCQKMVKQAFLDKEITVRLRCTSANSINIARLLPQSTYYFDAVRKIDTEKPVTFVVPSGNFGNLTAGLLAQRMGLPVKRFVAAVNANDTFPLYLKTGKYIPKDSVRTYSNAMDVGNPSNAERIRYIFDDDIESIRDTIISNSFSDSETLEAIRVVNEKFKYVIDPHGAVGFLAAKENAGNFPRTEQIILETAHPAKFPEVSERAGITQPGTPERLLSCISKIKHSIKIHNNLNSFKEILFDS